MLEIIKTTYRNGAFVPHAPVDFPEGAEVEIFVENEKKQNDSKSEGVTEFINRANRREISDAVPLSDEERKKIMVQLLENMESNPIPENAPRKFTREELHERR